MLRRRVPSAVGGIDDAVDVAAGSSTTCVAHASGKVSCFGANGSGAICAGNQGCALPAEILGTRDVIRVTAGKSHACALSRSGGVVCWGRNDDGQLNGAKGAPSGPTAAPGIEDAIDVAAGSKSTCAVRRSGEVWCWGQADRGRVGDGAHDAKIEPPRPVASVSNAIAVASSGPRTCALRKDGSIMCWGGLRDESSSSNEVTTVTLVPGLSDARSISIGAGDLCATRAGGGIGCWGGQKPAVEVPGLSAALAVSVGKKFSCAALAGGQFACWGANLDGTLGNGDATWFAEPVEAEGIDDAVEVSTAEYGTCARRKNGTVTCWGGSARPDAAKPADVKGLTDATKLFVGFDKICATRSSGPPVCFHAGSGGSGPATIEVPKTAEKLAPRAIPALGVSAGRPFYFDRGGHGKHTSPVTGIAGITAIDGTYHTACAARRGADVACWQWDQDAFEAGLEGGHTFGVTPKPVAGTRDAIDIAMYSSACAVLASGNVACFLPTDAKATIRPDIDDATAIAGCGTAHCALRKSGEVSCWGGMGPGGDARWLANGGVSGIKDAVSVGIASYHACVATRAGKVLCWGSNLGGRLARHELIQSDTPISIVVP